MRVPSHGANPNKLYEAFNIVPPKSIIDFSVNTNPLGAPIALKSEFNKSFHFVTEYPDIESRELYSAISHSENIPASKLFVGNGGSQCIYLLSQLFAGKKVGLLEPTFSEYRTACTAYSCQIQSILLNEFNNWQPQIKRLKALIREVDVMFLCNPNNPTGTVIDEAILLDIIDYARIHHTTVIFDEAFYDFCETSISMIKYINEYSHIIILRSLTKMYHLAGIRLGYVVACENIIERLKTLQPPWSVNGVAQHLGVLCISDKAHVTKTKQLVDEERRRVFQHLAQLHYYVSPSTVNYYLLKDPVYNNQQDLLIYLLRQGIVPRHTYNFSGLDGMYIRLAIRTTEENDFLLEVLKRWKNK
ncbi:threonine-phosphate decarboxylase CobD [Cytobacillus sp. IB215316]|uniref:threonine-phosphate decarboxylase CobD n=1 Tax=Cytobacillus sp. IB215316 TaxID=3097354 RepID=UPI002A108CE3|nr:threonine-phosphate decarboxylase CobD [Cytobacillus sp. IB215316]MDX8359779.1 threonine-phosphate decarboxylase CobD [Cytobacillus sp. IB215316]